MKPQSLKSQIAAARKAHFATGGTLDTWIIRTRKGEKNPKARKNKKACRSWKEENDA